MRGRRHEWLKHDGLSILAYFLFLLYIMLSVTWLTRHQPDHLLWFCDVALLMTAIGLYFRSGMLLTAQLSALIAFHLLWNLDFWSFLVFDYLPVGATAYMFYQDLTPVEKSLSFFGHVFIIPAALYGVYVLGAPRAAWLVQCVQTSLLFLFTYLFTRPEENINLMFGIELLNISHANVPPLFYYALMIIILPLAVYLPTNWLLVKFIDRGRRERPDEVGSFFEGTKNEVRFMTRSQPSRLSPLLAIAAILMASLFSAGISYVADRKCLPDATLFQIAHDGNVPLEAVPLSTMSQPEVRILYGEGDGLRQAPACLWPYSNLPKQWSGFDHKLHVHTKGILREIAAEDIPSVPQEVLLQGIRSAPGSIVCAYVASDAFYLQTRCDLYGEKRAYEILCNIGSRGISEYVNPTTGELYPPTAHNEILGGGTGAIYALGTIEVLQGKIVARSSYYLVKRRGIRFPDDIWFVSKDGTLIPLLSRPTDPVNSRVAFQSPFSSVNEAPEVFACNFFGYEIRNLTNNPNGFDGFVISNGKPLDAIGWIGDTVVRYYTQREGNMAISEARDKK